MADKPQSFENHARFVPLFHGGVLGILALNLLWGLVRVVRFPSVDSVMGLLVGVALLGLCYYTRVFPLRVQDRLIRLEMRLRLHEVLPADLRSRIDALNHNQLVALRFASDAEMPNLVREVLDNGIKSRREIKQKIRNWQPDYLRC